MFIFDLGSCEDPKSKINNVTIAGCNEKICPVTKGQTYNISIGFTPNGDIDKLTAKVYAEIDGISVPFKIAQPDACANSNLKCPLKAGMSVLYKSNVTIPEIAPSGITTLVKWELLDGNGTYQVCIEFGAKVQ